MNWASAGRDRLSSGLSAVGRAVDRHPLRTTLALALSVAALHGWWIVTHRYVGGFDPDEAGHLADALRFRRSLLDGGPAALATELGNSGTAPLVPLLSVPLLLIGPVDPRTALLIQPLLLVVATMCICALALRLVAARAAVVGSLAFLTFPTTIHAAQSYWFGLGVTAAMGAALLAVIASDRGRNRWIWCFGLAVAAMVLMRTMAVAFVPAVVTAALIVVGRDRRGLLRLGASLVVATAIAAPWYVAANDTVFGYLLEYGYGDQASRFGAADPMTRLLQTPLDIVLGSAILLPLVTALSAGACLLRSARRGTLARLARPRERTALLAGALIGLVALMSSANRGGWFTLPLLTAVVPLGTEAVARGPRVLRMVATGLTATLGPLFLLTSWWILPFGTPVPLPSHYEIPLAEYDERFGSQHRSMHHHAAEEWRILSQDVAAHLRQLRDRSGAVPTVSGNFEMFNTNTLSLAGELDGWYVDPRVPDTLSASGRELAQTTEDWNRDGRSVERVIVIARHPHALFTPDLEVAEFDAEVRRSRWRSIREFPMPGEAGGSVVILRSSS